MIFERLNIKVEVIVPTATVVLLHAYSGLTQKDLIIRTIGTKEDKQSVGRHLYHLPFPLFAPKMLRIKAYDENGKRLSLKIVEKKTTVHRLIANAPTERFIPVAAQMSLNKYTGLQIVNGFKFMFANRLYLDNGKEEPTPARITHSTGLIEISNAFWEKRRFTVYNKLFIFLHEWGHFTLRTRDEFEADQFAIEIFKQLGVSQWETLESLVRLFEMIPLNQEREKRAEKAYNHIFGNE